jgi:hypothetical protein
MRGASLGPLTGHYARRVAVIQGQLEAHPDDSVPAREHSGRDLPSWPCEFDSRHPLHDRSPSQKGFPQLGQIRTGTAGFWQNLRRVAGFKVQYFAAVEPQHRPVPHLHAAFRGTIHRKIIRQVVALMADYGIDADGARYLPAAGRSRPRTH